MITVRTPDESDSGRWEITDTAVEAGTASYPAGRADLVVDHLSIALGVTAR